MPTAHGEECLPSPRGCTSKVSLSLWKPHHEVHTGVHPRRKEATQPCQPEKPGPQGSALYKGLYKCPPRRNQGGETSEGTWLDHREPGPRWAHNGPADVPAPSRESPLQARVPSIADKKCLSSQHEGLLYDKIVHVKLLYNRKGTRQTESCPHN